MKIAIVHDCIREYGGAERVVEVFHEMWPDAPVFTSFVDKKGLGIHAHRFDGWNIHTSWIQSFPMLQKFISPLRFIIPLIWRQFDFSSYDAVLTSSGWFMSRGVKVTKPTVHFCYIHHPPRNMYGYATGSNLQRFWIVRVYAAVLNFFLRHYDFAAAQRVDFFIANSKETARRVEKFYRKPSVVIYPPIQLDRKETGNNKLKAVTKNQEPETRSYYLSVGRLSWSKRIDIAIAACNQLKKPLKVVGAGKEAGYLRTIAGPTIEFAGGVTDEHLDMLYSGAKALIFSALDEDFGMVPVEAMARGVPVIALSEGGVKETVIDGETGVLFETATKEACMTAIQTFESMKKDWKAACRKQAELFSKERFMKEMKSYIMVHGHEEKLKI